MKQKAYLLLLAAVCMLPMISLNLLAAAGEPQPQEYPFSFQDPSIPEETPVTRAQAAALLTRALGVQRQADLQSYADVPENAWYHPEMARAVAAGLLEGYDNHLRPEDPLTRQEAGLVFSRLLSGGEKDGELTELAALQPREPLSRGDFLRFANRLLPQSLEPGSQGWEMDSSTLINRPGTYSQLKVEGDLILSEGAETGPVVIQDAIISGRILIRGGGSVQLKDRVLAQKIQVAPSSNHLRLDSRTQLPQTVTVQGNFTYLNGNFTVISLERAGSQTMLSGSAETVSLLTENSSLHALSGCQVAFAEIRGEGCTILGQGQVKQAAVSAANAHIDTAGTAILSLPGSSQVWANGLLVPPGLHQTTEPAQPKQQEKTTYPPVVFPSVRPSEPSTPDQPGPPPEQPESPPSADSVALDMSCSSPEISGLESATEEDTLVLKLQLQGPLSGTLPEGLEEYFTHSHPQGPVSVVGLSFPLPPDLQPEQPVTLTYTSRTMLEMGYSPLDDTESLSYRWENGLLQVEQRFSAGQIPEKVPLILPFSGREERCEIRLNWGEDQPEQKYRLEIPEAEMQILSQPEVRLISSETGPMLQIDYQRSGPAEQSRVLIGPEGKEPIAMLESQQLQEGPIQLFYPLDLNSVPILLEENWQVTVEEHFQGKPQSAQWKGRFSASQWAEALPSQTDSPYTVESAYIDPMTPEEDIIQQQLDDMWLNGDTPYAGLFRFDQDKSLLLVDISKTEGLFDWCQTSLGQPRVPISLASTPSLPGVEITEEWALTPILWLDAEQFVQPHLTCLSADGLPPFYLLFYDGQSDEIPLF